MITSLSEVVSNYHVTQPLILRWYLKNEPDLFKDYLSVIIQYYQFIIGQETTNTSELTWEIKDDEWSNFLKMNKSEKVSNIF